MFSTRSSVKTSTEETSQHRKNDENMQHPTTEESKNEALKSAVFNALLSKCKITDPSKTEIVRKLFEELYEIKILKLFLQIAAKSEKIKFIFDFNSEDLKEINPRKYFKAKSPENFLLNVAAKKLLNEEYRFEVYGVFAHEICHFVLNLLYRNNCKPYKKNNEERKKEFDDVVKQCEDEKIEHEVIWKVFDCEPKNWHLELIARVFHLSALYKKDPEKLEKLRQTFKALFEFYEKRTKPDIQKLIKSIQLETKVRECNESLGLSRLLELEDDDIEVSNVVLEFFKNRIIIAVYCVKSALFAIKNSNRFCLFVSLQSLQNQKTIQTVHEALKLSKKVLLCVSCEDETVEKVEEMLKMLQNINSTVVFVVEKVINLDMISSKFEKISIHQNWASLTKKTQEKLLQKEMTFQGMKIKFCDLLNEDSKALVNFPLNIFMPDEEITIGQEITNDVDEFYVQRSFLKPEKEGNSRLNCFDILKIAQEDKTIVLSDEPGSGKSTEFKILASKLKQLYPHMWVVFITFERMTTAIQGLKKNSIDSSFEFSDLAKMLATKFLNLENFEAEIFIDLFDSDKVALFFDGIDEVEQTHVDFLIKILTEIRETTGNLLFISTRPQLKNELEKNLYTRSMSLEKFSSENKMQMIKKLFENESAKMRKILEIIHFHETYESKNPRESNMRDSSMYDEDLDSEPEEPDCLRSIVRKTKPSNVSSGYLISNPLFLKVFAQSSELDLRLMNAFSLYRKFYSKFTQHCVKKNTNFSNQMMPDYFRFRNIKQHQHLAFQKFFEHSKDPTVWNCLNQCFKELSTPDFEKIGHFGLVSVLGNGRFEFVHESFADFLISEFIVQKVVLQIFHMRETFNAILKLFKIMLSNGNCQRILNFLNEAVLIDKFVENSETEDNRRGFREVFSEVEMNSLENFKNLQNFLIKNFMNNDVNMPEEIED